MADLPNRRPLKSRNTRWAQAITAKLAGTGITPNQISAASMGFAALAGVCFAGTVWTSGVADVLLLVAGAVAVQMRLLCNLLDGMVAVEAGRADPTGPFWNEVPDRIADALIIVGLGIGSGVVWLGWAAACLAVFISYLRAFGGSLGQTADYSGPMAKQHRMATVTLTALVAVLLRRWFDPAAVLLLGLLLLILGGIVTSVRRMVRIQALLSEKE